MPIEITTANIKHASCRNLGALRSVECTSNLCKRRYREHGFRIENQNIRTEDIHPLGRQPYEITFVKKVFESCKTRCYVNKNHQLIILHLFHRTGITIQSKKICIDNINSDANNKCASNSVMIKVRKYVTAVKPVSLVKQY